MIFGKDMEDAAADVGRVLAERGLKIATAESLTGGLIAGALTSVPGSSGWVMGGVVTYCNDAKAAMLGVSKSSLWKHGAVSEVVAKEMAKGALERSGADIAVAVTGVAGPGPSDGVAAGTVCYGVASKDGDGGVTVSVMTWRFEGGRSEVREATVLAVLKDVAKIAGNQKI